MATRASEDLSNVPCMTLWQSVDLTSLLDCESSRPITTLQILEAVDWNTTGAGSELKQSTLLFGVPRADDLPELLNDFVLLLVASVVCVLLPVVNINVSDATNEKLKLALVKHIDKVGRNEFIETRDESVELFFDTLDDLPLGYESAAC